jgi:hypothetical protein
VPVAHARHTAEPVPAAELRTFDGLARFHIDNEVLPAVQSLLPRVSP